MKAITRKLSLLVCLAIGIAACNQEFSKVIPEGEPVDSVNVAFGSPRVLYIIADGARGKSVHEAETPAITRSEEHTSELQSLMRTSYAVFCLRQKKNDTR